jgi:hypothetical protein
LLPLNPPAAFRLRRLTSGINPSSPAFPSGRPSGLPLSGALTLVSAPSSEAALWHAFDLPLPPACADCPVWPSRPVSRTCVPFPSPPAIDLRIVPPLFCSGLAAFASCGANSLRPVDHRALDPRRACAPLNPPSRLFQPAFGLRLAPHWYRPLSPALASPLSLKSSSRLASTPGSSVRDGALACAFACHPSGAFQAVLEAHASRPALPDSPFGSNHLRLACALHPWPVRPACLRFPSGLRPPGSAPAPPRARSAI